MLWKCCMQYVSKFGRTSSGLRAGKYQSPSKFPRGVVLKIVPTMGQFHSTPVLIRSCLKSCMLGFSITWTKNFQMSKLGLEKAEEPDQTANILCIIEKAREFQKTFTSVSLITLKLLWIITNCGKLAFKEMGIPDHLTVSWETCMCLKRQQLEPCMEQLIGSIWRNEYKRAVCCHPFI